jgi:hypothetical protein
VKKEEKDTPVNSEEQGSHIRNIGKIVFLIAALVAAWFVLEWLMGSK